MECPEDMMNVDRHVCFDCYMESEDKISEQDIIKGKIHVDIPMDKMDDIMPDIMVSHMVEEIFPRVWKEKKSEMREMSKRQVAEYMFAVGAGMMIESIIQMAKENDRKNTK